MLICSDCDTAASCNFGLRHIRAFPRIDKLDILHLHSFREVFFILIIARIILHVKRFLKVGDCFCLTFALVSATCRRFLTIAMRRLQRQQGLLFARTSFTSLDVANRRFRRLSALPTSTACLSTILSGAPTTPRSRQPSESRKRQEHRGHISVRSSSRTSASVHRHARLSTPYTQLRLYSLL